MYLENSVLMFFPLPEGPYKPNENKDIVKKLVNFF